MTIFTQNGRRPRANANSVAKPSSPKLCGRRSALGNMTTNAMPIATITPNGEFRLRWHMAAATHIEPTKAS